MSDHKFIKGSIQITDATTVDTKTGRVDEYRTVDGELQKVAHSEGELVDAQDAMLKQAQVLDAPLQKGFDEAYAQATKNGEECLRLRGALRELADSGEAFASNANLDTVDRYESALARARELLK